MAGDINGDGLTDRVVIGLRADPPHPLARDFYIDFGTGTATGPLAGTFGSDAPFGPLDVIGGIDLDVDRRAELIVRLDSNQALLAVARVSGCDIVVVNTSSGERFTGNPAINGHDCCPFQYAQFDCVAVDGALEIVTTYSYPSKPDGSYVSGTDLIEHPVSDPLELTYTTTREHWRYLNAVMQLVAKHDLVNVGHNLPSDLLTSGFDCFQIHYEPH